MIFLKDKMGTNIQTQKSRRFSGCLHVVILSLLSALLFQQTALASPKDDARQKLLAEGFSFSEETMQRRIEQGDLESVKLFLDAGMSANSNLGNRFRPLMSAAAFGETRIVQLLLSRGAKVNDRDEWKDTALMSASRPGYCDIVKILLGRGAEVNARDEYGWTALMYAASEGRIRTANILLAAGADVNITGKDLPSHCVQPPNILSDLLDRLFRRGPRFPADESKTLTALSVAAANRYPETAKAILRKGPNVNVAGKDGLSAIIYAAQNGEEELVQLLLERGARIAPSGGSEMAAFEAVVRNQPERLQKLLQAGADPNALYDGRTLLMIAARLGYLDIVKTLVERGADPNVKTRWGERTVLVDAAWRGREDVVEFLLAQSPEQKVKNRALVDAAGEGHVGVARILIESGADVNAKGYLDSTALEDVLFAMFFEPTDEELLNRNGELEDKEDVLDPVHWKNLQDTLRLLLAKGADVNADGSESFFYAVCWLKTEIVRVLVENGASVTAHDEDGFTALIYAASWGRTETVEVLLAAGAELNERDTSGATALMCAARNGYPDTVHALLKAGADVNAKDRDGRTALEYARMVDECDLQNPVTRESSFEIIEMLKQAQLRRLNHEKQR